MQEQETAAKAITGAAGSKINLTGTTRVWTTLRVQNSRGPSQGDFHSFLVSPPGAQPHNNSK